MKYLKLTAFFLVFLVVTIPLYSSSAMALSLTVDKISGGDEIDGYRLAVDSLLIDVTAFIDDDANITANQVYAESEPFNSCAGVGAGYYSCSYKFDSDEKWEAKKHTFNIYLKNDAQETLTSTTADIIVDDLAPEITKFDITQDFVGKENLTADWEAKDEAYSGSTECSGLDYITFYLGKTEELESYDLNEVCTDSGTFSFEVVSAPEGNVTICMTATDALDQQSDAKCDNVIVDTLAPVVEEVKIMKDNKEIEYVSKPISNAVVWANITDANGIDKDRIYANLTSLNINPRPYQHMKGNCNEGICTWNVDIELNDTVTAELNFDVVDIVNNTDTVPFSVTLSVDKVKPEITYLGSFWSTEDMEVSYIREKNNTLMVIIDKPTGAGFDEEGKNTKLYLHNVNPKYSKTGTKADSCYLDEKEDLWVCLWEDIDTNKQNGAEIRIDTAGICDNAGNCAEPLSDYVYVDLVPPKILNYSIKAISLEGKPVSFFKGGDYIEVVMNISDFSDVKAIGDFSAVSQVNEVEGSCEFIDNETQQCVWGGEANKVGPLLSGYLKEQINFTVRDAVENEVFNKTFIEILAREGIEDIKNPDFWTVKVADTYPIDRQIAPYIPNGALVYFKLKLKTKQNGVRPLKVVLDGCKARENIVDFDGQTVDPMKVLKEAPKLSYVDMTEPYIIMNLQQSEMKFNSLPYNCTLGIVSEVTRKKSGKKVKYITEVEKRTAPIDIKFYNMPMGTIDSNIKKGLEDNIKTIRKLDSGVLRLLEQILEWSEKICRLTGIINSATGIINSIMVVGDIFRHSPAYTVAESMKRTQQGSHIMNTAIMKELQRFCEYIRCDKSLIRGWGGWYKKVIDKTQPKVLEWAKNSHFNCRGSKQVEKNGKNTTVPSNCGATIWPASPKDSFILSVATGCIPGIIYNLNKYKQIQCEYVRCVTESYSVGAVPLDACEKQKHYMTCKQVFGEYFQVVPFAAFFKQLGNMIKTMFSDPVSMGISIVGFVCERPTNEATYWCIVPTTLTKISSDISTMKYYSDTRTWKVQADSCKGVLDKAEQGLGGSQEESVEEVA